MNTIRFSHENSEWHAPDLTEKVNLPTAPKRTQRKAGNTSKRQPIYMQYSDKIARRNELFDQLVVADTLEDPENRGIVGEECVTEQKDPFYLLKTRGNRIYESDVAKHVAIAAQYEATITELKKRMAQVEDEIKPKLVYEKDLRSVYYLDSALGDYIEKQRSDEYGPNNYHELKRLQQEHGRLRDELKSVSDNLDLLNQNSSIYNAWAIPLVLRGMQRQIQALFPQDESNEPPVQ